MILLLIPAFGLLFFLLFITNEERKRFAEDNLQLMLEREAFVEALNRAPYPADAGVILSEWQRS